MEDKKEQKEIGGWLILILIGLIINPIRLLIKVFVELIPIKGSEAWTLFGDKSSSDYQNLFRETVNFEIIANSIFIIFALILLILFLRKQRLFPKLFVIYLALNLIFVIADLVLIIDMPLIATGEVQESLASRLFGAILMCAIWIPVILVSKRSKETFVE